MNMVDCSANLWGWNFDVFLSFRGEDTRSNFTSHLDMALRQRGINVFIDYKLPRGEDISTSLLKSIDESRISIVIFSENYASSSWCLDELVKIMDCKKSKGQIVFPVFYKVEPSDIRKLIENFGNLMAKHRPKHSKEMQPWKEALAALPPLSGWVLQNEIEADIIQKIVQEVLAKLHHKTLLDIAKYPVGIDSQINVMSSLLNFTSPGETTMVGIYGIGGMGKTTLAKAIYNKIAKFYEGHCFLANVRKASEQYNGLVQLQEKLLSEILMDNVKDIGNVDRGITIIKERLRSKKVLIVIDDVDKGQQLAALAGKCDWFGKESKIIVTTRNLQLLSCDEFGAKHHIKKWNDVHALELFSWHAFNQNEPPSDHTLQLSNRAVDYCHGLPLAIEVLGSFLCSRDYSEWNKLIDAFKKSSLDKDIQVILQRSYDALEDGVKEIFLDICCFFIGEDIDDVKKRLEARHSYNTDKGIIKLIDLSLLTIDQFSNKVQMHELIQQMGRTIALPESSAPRKRKRLWTEEDVMDVLDADMEANAVKTIKLSFPKPTQLDIDANAFKNVKDLRLLIVQNATFSKVLEYLPNKLQWIDWNSFPFSSFPSSYTPTKLVGLNLQDSSIKRFGKNFMNFRWLKHFDLRRSRSLEEIPDFSSAVNLEILNLSYCENLKTVHESVGSLGKLVDWRLPGCYNLEHLPKSLNLKSLEHLLLEDCRSLKQFPEIGDEMRSLENIDIDLRRTNLKELPPSIGNLTGLSSLNLKGCINLITLHSISHTISWSNLAYLNLKDCNISSEEIEHLVFKASLGSKLSRLNLEHCNIPNADFIENLSDTAASSLVELNLSRNSFRSLPSCIVNFTALRSLKLRDCELLEEIPKVPTYVCFLDARGCTALSVFPDNLADLLSCMPMYYAKEMKLDCRQIILMNCPHIPESSDIPELFGNQNMGNSITWSVSCDSLSELEALAPSVIFEVNQDLATVPAPIYIKCEILIEDIVKWSSRVEFSACGSKSKYMWLQVIDSESPAWLDVYGGLFFINLGLRKRKDISVLFEVDTELHKDMVTIRSCGLHGLISECSVSDMDSEELLELLPETDYEQLSDYVSEESFSETDDDESFSVE